LIDTAEDVHVYGIIAIREWAWFACELRRRELLGQKWSDVDLAARSITVRRNRTQAGPNIVDVAPKTKASRRVLDLDDRSAGALLGWNLTQSAEAEAWGDEYADRGYVFTYENGEPLKPQYATRLFEKLRVQSKLPRITFHGQRHEAASLVLAAGADVSLVAKRMGHTSVSITSDIYSQMIGSASRQGAENAAALVPTKTRGAQATRCVTKIEKPGQRDIRVVPGLSCGPFAKRLEVRKSEAGCSLMQRCIRRCTVGKRSNSRGWKSTLRSIVSRINHPLDIRR
jgi:hypothetical protein